MLTQAFFGERKASSPASRNCRQRNQLIMLAMRASFHTARSISKTKLVNCSHTLVVCSFNDKCANDVSFVCGSLHAAHETVP